MSDHVTREILERIEWHEDEIERLQRLLNEREAARVAWEREPIHQQRQAKQDIRRMWQEPERGRRRS